MKTAVVSGVQPALLRWARLSIGLSAAEVAAKLKRHVDEIEDWESGVEAPTYSQLEKLAYEVYKRPLALFFLPTVPEEKLPEQEFRTLPEADPASLDPDTHLRIRHAHAYQIALNEVFGGRNPVSQKIWDRLHLGLQDSVVEQSATLRDFLGIPLSEQTAWRDNARALKEWRSAIERAGVFVFNWTFRQKDISGFSLLDPEFPLIYVNNSNSKSRQTFSLFHELAHILMNMGGVCKDDVRSVNALPGESRDVEQFCNRIAAEALVPTPDFLIQAGRLPSNAEEAGDQVFADLAARYSVSREVILRRLLDLGRVTASFYAKAAARWSSQQTPGSGGNYYATINTCLSQRFAQEVVRSHARNQITVDEAADLLGVKGRNYIALEEQILKGEAA